MLISLLGLAEALQKREKKQERSRFNETQGTVEKSDAADKLSADPFAESRRPVRQEKRKK